MAISNVVKNGQYYELYDASGKKSKSIHSNTVGELMGFGSVFFIAKKGSSYVFYDDMGRKYKSVNCVAMKGDFISFSGETIVMKNGNYLETYDKNGKKINSKLAR